MSAAQMAEVNVSLPHCHLCVVFVSFNVVPFLFNSGWTPVFYFRPVIYTVDFWYLWTVVWRRGGILYQILKGRVFSAMWNHNMFEWKTLYRQLDPVFCSYDLEIICLKYKHYKWLHIVHNSNYSVITSYILHTFNCTIFKMSIRLLWSERYMY